MNKIYASEIVLVFEIPYKPTVVKHVKIFVLKKLNFGVFLLFEVLQSLNCANAYSIILRLS